MNTDRARLTSAILPRYLNQILRSSVCASALAAALAVTSPPAADTGAPKDKHGPKHNETAHVSKDPFDNMPKGPLQIVISINQQKLHLYSDGAHVADALIASGVPGHPTPMGVFSIIAKERYHRSNIYSGAPMPYMQRITWSGVAMHEGVGLGHPASHGCIRMPHEFATRLFLLHSLGARVVIARPELKLADIADPHLFVHKVVTPPAANAAAPPTSEAIKTAQTIDSSRTTDAELAAVLAGPVDGARPFVSLKDPTAPGAVAKPASAAEASRDDAAPDAKSAAPQPAPTKEGYDSSAGDAGHRPNAATGAHEDTHDAPATAAADRAGAKAKDRADGAEAQAAEPLADKPVAATAGGHAGDPAATTAAEQPSAGSAAKVATERAPTAAAVADPKTDPKPDSAPAESGAADGSETGKPTTPAAAVAVPAPAEAAPPTVPVPAPKPAAIAKPAKHDPIAIFVSRKTKKIYVRQNFAPLFDAAIAIAHPDEPLGTHVFTAVGYLDDGATFRWNVVSLPGEEPKAHPAEKKSEKNAKGNRREPVAKPNPDPQPPQTPQQVLARIEIPQNVIDQISELMVPGSSLVVSDHGLGEETGEGTDFIVVTR